MISLWYNICENGKEKKDSYLFIRLYILYNYLYIYIYSIVFLLFKSCALYYTNDWDKKRNGCGGGV
jgi:hypothetical protein